MGVFLAKHTDAILIRARKLPLKNSKISKFEKIENMVIQVLLKQQLFPSNKNAYLIYILQAMFL